MTKETGDRTPVGVLPSKQTTEADKIAKKKLQLIENPPEYLDSEPPQDYNDIENILNKSFDNLDENQKLTVEDQNTNSKMF